MRFSITFKNPDAVDDALEIYDNKESLKRFLKKWIEYEEYITVSFDTEKGTAEVKQLK